MGSSLSSTSSAITPPDSRAQSIEDTENYIRLEQEQVLGNQLSYYSKCLDKNQHQLNAVEKSFIPVANSSIINIMGKKQCESYQKYHSFTTTDLNIMRSIHKLPHFDADKHSEVKHLIEPLKKAFQMGKLNEVSVAINYMKNIQVYKGCSFTTIDYQLLDILEYMTEICLNNDNNPANAFTHWTNIFDMLFRGTNIKLSNRKSRFADNKNDEENETMLTKDTILFQCHSQNTFGQQNNIELSTCSVSYKDENDTLEQNDDKEAISQSKSILVNKSILECLVNDHKHSAVEDLKDFFPIGIQLFGYEGYLYSIRSYKGIHVASQVCGNTLFIPQTIDEFESFLFNGHVLEMLCNLKRHYVGIAKVVRHASSNRNSSSWITK